MAKQSKQVRGQDAAEAKHDRNNAKRCALDATEAVEEIDPTELKRQRKAAKKAAVEEAMKEAEKCAEKVDPAEVKQQRKAAKKAAAEESMKETRANGEGVGPAEEKRQRKTAKNSALAHEEVVAEAVGLEEIEQIEAKRLKRAARKAALAAATEDDVVAETKPADVEQLQTPNKEHEPVLFHEDEQDETPPRSKKNSKASSDTANGAMEKFTGEDVGQFRVFVAGFPFACTEEVLRKKFGKCGEITKLKLPLDRQTGESRGIAFITYATEAGLDAALNYDGKEYKGRPIKVRKANAYGADFKVFVAGLPTSGTEEALQSFLGECGSFTEVKVINNVETGKSRGIAFVCFADEKGYNAALEKHGQQHEGLTVKVSKAKGANAKAKDREAKGRGKGKGKGKGTGRGHTLVQRMTQPV